MPRGRPKAELILTELERQTLKTWAARPKSSQQLAQRVRIVLACADGSDNKVVAARLGVTPQTVGKWRKRFLVQRLDGLTDQPRPGAPRKVTDEDVEKVITKTLETKPKNATHWSTRGMAEATGMSQSMIDAGHGKVCRENKKMRTECRDASHVARLRPREGAVTFIIVLTGDQATWAATRVSD